MTASTRFEWSQKPLSRAQQGISLKLPLAIYMYAYNIYSMIKKHDDLIGSIVHDVAHLIRLRIDKQIKKYGLTRVKWLALGVIQNNPLMTQAELAAELELGEPATGRLSDRLEERGLIERRAGRADRRVRKLKLTLTAERLLDDMREVSGELRGGILNGIPQEDLHAMERGLKALKRNLKLSIVSLFASALASTNSTTYQWAETFAFIA
jgi:MarR family transcriptional regulator for hemolysin